MSKTGVTPVIFIPSPGYLHVVLYSQSLYRVHGTNCLTLGSTALLWTGQFLLLTMSYMSRTCAFILLELQ